MNSSSSDSTAKKTSRATGLGPRLKKRNDWVPSMNHTHRRSAMPREMHNMTAKKLFFGEDVAELVHTIQRLAGAAHHAGEVIVGDHCRQAGLFHQQAVAVARQG